MGYQIDRNLSLDLGLTMIDGKQVEVNETMQLKPGIPQTTSTFRGTSEGDAWLAGLHSLGAISALLVAGVLTYAALARLHPRRQFLHDVVCGTQLVTWRPVRPRRPAARGGIISVA